jgi:hypothetical protein
MKHPSEQLIHTTGIQAMKQQVVWISNEGLARHKVERVQEKTVGAA